MAATIDKAKKQGATSGSAYVMLIMATLGFAINFWAWALLSPLGTQYGQDLSLSSFQVSFFVAVPVIVGSLGRIPVGGLTDKYGGRIMFPLISIITIIPVLFLAFLGTSSYAALLIGGFFLGIGGTAFAVGVPFVNGWFPPERRGFAIGFFGAGMGGTAISALTTVPLVKAGGNAFPFLITAAALAIYAVLAWLIMRDAPGRVAPTTSLSKRLGSVLKIPATWQAAILYSILFGGYVAFAVYLPTYLKTDYGLDPADASNRMAGFVVVAVIARPIGGWLSDKIGPINVLSACLSIVLFMAIIRSFHLELMPWGTIVFLLLAAGLGAGSGATFAYVAKVAPPDKVGAMTGFVGAAGGLGGFIPPLVMGAVYGSTGSYQWGFVLLALVVGLVLLFTETRFKATYDEKIAEVSS